MDRAQTEALFAEAQRLRESLIDASVKLSTFTQQLRALLDIAEDTSGQPKEDDCDER